MVDVTRAAYTPKKEITVAKQYKGKKTKKPVVTARKKVTRKKPVVTAGKKVTKKKPVVTVRKKATKERQLADIKKRYRSTAGSGKTEETSVAEKGNNGNEG
jgi:hypothetical protein